MWGEEHGPWLGSEASVHTRGGKFHQQRSSDDNVQGQPVAAGSCTPQENLLSPTQQPPNNTSPCVRQGTRCPTRELFREGFALPAKSKAVEHSAQLQLGLADATQLGGGGLPLEVQAEKDLEILATGMAVNHAVNLGELPGGFSLPFGKAPETRNDKPSNNSSPLGAEC